ncbi:MAG: hypothetical protein H6Q14_2958 [Bacteroidetes bacterium]|nr:hypothetical protein [Bacteroidota bacterium]
MNLPTIVKCLLQAQANFDSLAYSACFVATAVVLDEGKTYIGTDAIMKWNESTNNEYQTVLEPVDFRQDDNKFVLTAKVSGSFEGSPVLLDYHIEKEGELIASLAIILH